MSNYQQSPPSEYPPAGPQQPYNLYQQPSYGQPLWMPQPNAGWQPQPNQGYPPQGYAPQGYPQQYGYPPAPFSPGAPYQPDQNFQNFAQQAPPPQQYAIFKWTSPSSSVLNTTVLDPNGREAFHVQSPKKKETLILNSSQEVIAKIEWSSTPTISLRGAKSMKIKDWIPFSKQTDCRSLTVNGDNYRLAEQDSSVLVFKNNSAAHSGILSDPNDILHLELAPELLSLTEEFVIIATIFQSGHPIEKSGWLDQGAFHTGMMGGLGGAIVTNAS